MKRSEIKLIETAIRKRWGLSDEHKRRVVQTMVALLGNDEASARDQIAASKVLVAIESQNLADEHKQVDVIQTGNRFLGIAERLGIGESATDTSPADAAPSPARASK